MQTRVRFMVGLMRLEVWLELATLKNSDPTLTRLWNSRSG